MRPRRPPEIRHRFEISFESSVAPRTVRVLRESEKKSQELNALKVLRENDGKKKKKDEKTRPRT